MTDNAKVALAIIRKCITTQAGPLTPEEQRAVYEEIHADMDGYLDALEIDAEERNA